MTSTEESSGTDRDQQPSEEVNSGSGSGSGRSSSRVLDDSLSSSLTERDEEENETATNDVRCSSEEVSRILASAAEADDNEKDDDDRVRDVDDEDVAEWRQVVTDMTECIDFCPPLFLILYYMNEI